MARKKKKVRKEKTHDPEARGNSKYALKYKKGKKGIFSKNSPFRSE